MIKQTFDAGWEYAEGGTYMGMLLTPTQPVTLPHDASIGKARRADHPSGSGGGYAWNGVVSYRKRFHAPSEWQGQRVQFEFEGVMMYAEVMVNGQLVALHPYGYTSFLVDLTPYLQYGADNEVIVTANNSAQPNSRWYTGTGLYRHIWLRQGGKLHIPPWGVFVTTPQVAPATSMVAVATELTNTSDAPATAVLRSTIQAASGATVAQDETTLDLAAHTTLTASQQLPVADAQLWSVDTPYLYTLTSEVFLAGAVVDRETTRFGIRSIAVDPSNGFLLNGVPMKLKGGNVHHDHGLLGAASYDRAEERKVELMKSAGFNALRCAHNPPAPALLDACDRLGMLVIDESFDMWRMGKSTNDYHLYFEQWWQRDTGAMVKRDRNHPSVIMWSIGNEIVESMGRSDGYAWSRKQADYVRALDPTRLVTQALPILFDELLPLMAQGGDAVFAYFVNAPTPTPDNDRWGRLTEAFAAPLDVAGYNYLAHRYDYDSDRFPARVMCGTESFSHQAFAIWEATTRCRAVIGDFVWTAVDYLGESGIAQVAVDQPLPELLRVPYPYHLANCGDFDICGFKRPQSYYRDILWGVRTVPYIGVLDPQLYGKTIRFSPWGWEPVLDSWTYPGWEGKPTRVDVYSADEEVELLINGRSAGRKPAGTTQQNKATFEVTYQPGTLVAVGFTGGAEQGRTELTTAGLPAALRLTPDRTTIDAAAGNLSYVTVEIVDEHGTLVPRATDEVSFEITWPGELIAVGTANPVSEESYVGTQRKAFQGRLMVVVRSSGQEGAIRLTATANGLVTAETSVSAFGQ